MFVDATYFDGLAWLTLDYAGIALVIALLTRQFVPHERRWLQRWVALIGLCWVLTVFGAWTNRVAMYANDGHMPVKGLSPMAWIFVGLSGDEVHVPYDETTKLGWLTDILRCPAGTPRWIANEMGIFSVGDVMIIGGRVLWRALLIPCLLTIPLFRRRSPGHD